MNNTQITFSSVGILRVGISARPLHFIFRWFSF